MQIDVNGTLLDKEEAFAGIEHRGLNYGDGLFESMRLVNGQVPLLSDHIRRLKKGMKVLKISIPKNYNTAFFRKRIKILAGDQAFARLRLTVFRAAGGLYTPRHHSPTYILNWEPLSADPWSWSATGLKVDICPAVQLPVTALSGIKTINALPYVLAGIWRAEQELDDCILLNQRGEVAESGSSNIFYFKDNNLFTPEDRAGGVNGVMRNLVIRKAKRAGILVNKKRVTVKDLLGADEVFLTNAVRGARWVERIGTTLFVVDRRSSILLLGMAIK